MTTSCPTEVRESSLAHRVLRRPERDRRDFERGGNIAIVTARSKLSVPLTVAPSA
jgi:hypothetical protein